MNTIDHNRLFGPGRIEPCSVTHCDRCLGMRWLNERGIRHIEITDCEHCVTWLSATEPIVCGCGKTVEEH